MVGLLKSLLRAQTNNKEVKLEKLNVKFWPKSTQNILNRISGQMTGSYVLALVNTRLAF